MTGLRRYERERGSMAIELAIAMPLLLTLLAMTMVLGRSASAVSAVEMAAYDGARTASLARDYDSAAAAATASIIASLQRQGYGCADGPQVMLRGIPPDPWTLPVGLPASVVVEVSCWISYVDIGGVALAGRHVHRVFVSPLDRYRVRA